MENAHFSYDLALEKKKNGSGFTLALRVPADIVFLVIIIIIIVIINSGKRTEWSPIRSVIIRVFAGVRFVSHEYDYRPTSDDTKSTYQSIIKITIFEKHKK